MINAILIKILKGVLWILDKDHRTPENISVHNDKKFTHVQSVNFKSDFGTAKKVFRTIPYEVWQLKTNTKELLAADKHLIIKEDRSECWIQDLKIGDRIITDNGIEEVIVCRSLNCRTHMYDIEVETDNLDDENNHLYYSNGILSHNTTCASAYLLWKAMFTPDTTILLVANKFVQALEIMERIKYAYENLPDYIRAGVNEYNKSTISFDNGSRIIARATTSDAGRGLAISLLYADEFAFVQPNIQRDFWAAIQPVLSTGGGCIITSTPKNDEDQFAQIWKGANDNTDEFGNIINDSGIGRNHFYPFKSPWWEHPERDEDWAKPFRESLGPAKFAQEFSCEFVTDDETLINSLLLSRLKTKNPEFYTGTTRWYEAPKANTAYLVALDPSLGTGRDYASIQVFKIPEMVQVAEWQHNETAPRGQVRALLQILVYLDSELRNDDEQESEPEIYWTFENNSIGEAILQILEDTGEERFPGILINEKKRKGQTRRFRKGMTTTSRNKLSACARLKSLMESERMKINSTNLLKEFKNFVATDNSFKAKPGEHDDLVMATLLIVRMLDVALMWSESAGKLKEYISEDELSDGDDDTSPMPIVL